MSDLNLSEIQDQLNKMFKTFGERKLIFWFDADAEFEDDIDNNQILLNDAEVYKLEPHSEFKAKRFFEIEDTENSYLVYAPFEKLNDDDENNHLLSLIEYSKLFNADRISLIMKQLNIAPDFHKLMGQYTKFFGAKSRIASFEKIMNAQITSEEQLELTIIAALVKSNNTQMNSILQSVILAYAENDDSLYGQLETYGLQDRFWHYIQKYYGYSDSEPSIQKLIITFFVNTLFTQMEEKNLPVQFKEYEIFNQTTAIVSFMDGFMNDTRYVAAFDKLSKLVFKLINGKSIVSKYAIEKLYKTDVFEEIHTYILKYYMNQLVDGDLTPVVDGLSLEEMVLKKERDHFGKKFIHQYEAILSGQAILSFPNRLFDDFPRLVRYYEEEAFLVDQNYRKFIYHLDYITEKEIFSELHKRVENNYKKYLDNMGMNWNNLFVNNDYPSILDFYDRFASNGVKTVVIISDALRYEVAREIQTQLDNEKKYSTKLSSILTVLPSITEFGKAALLKSNNLTLEYIDGYDVRVSGMKTQGTDARDKILKMIYPDNLAISYDKVVEKTNSKDLREYFNGKNVIYLYHDRIDRTGDHSDEKQVFGAVERAIKEIKNLIPFISNGANIVRFIVTSDHGFIYRRSAIEEFDKIENPSVDNQDRVERRFVISEHHYEEIGIGSMNLGEILHNDDKRFIHYPLTSSIFKKAGGGQNYVHGGSSPQEMLVPVLEINVARGSAQKDQVSVQLMNSRRKIIGLSTRLEFYQMEAISDSVTKGKFSLYFEDGNGERISTENSYFADSTSTKSSDRFTTFTFEFIDRPYNANEKVFLIIKDAVSNIEIDRIDFVIDNAYAGGFGFDI